MATKKIKRAVEIPIDDFPSHPPEFEQESESEIATGSDAESSAAPTSIPAAPPRIGEIDKEKVLGFIEEFLDTLTFTRVGLIALLTVITLSLFALYENRSNIIAVIVEPIPKITSSEIPVWELSEKSKQSLQKFAIETDVAFISIADVDLQKNRKKSKYNFIDDPSIKLEPAISQALALPQAMFDYDPKNTDQMVAVLTNEFRCDAYRDTVYFRYAPELAEKLPLVCRMAVPPFVGQFVGFVSVILNRNMTRLELDTIRLEISRIAVEIYLRDVIKKPSVH